MALTDLNAMDDSKSRTKTVDALYIYSDLCKESIVHGVEQPLLRRLDRNKAKRWDYMLDTPYYLPVKRKEQRIRNLYKIGRRYIRNRVEGAVAVDTSLKAVPVSVN